MANSDAKTTATTDALDPRAFRQALGQFPTGVAVVTATHDNYPIGMTANSFSSVSLAPPLVSWSVAKSSPNHDPFVAAEAFAVHFLGADHHELALRFGQRGADKFAGLAHAPGDTGAPLIEGLAPIFECRAWARYPGGDHTIVVGAVREIVGPATAKHPLLYHEGRYSAMRLHPLRAGG